eukprot:3570347-Rhodomonas_salina.2
MHKVPVGAYHVVPDLAICYEAVDHFLQLFGTLYEHPGNFAGGSPPEERASHESQPGGSGGSPRSHRQTPDLARFKYKTTHLAVLCILRLPTIAGPSAPERGNETLRGLVRGGHHLKLLSGGFKNVCSGKVFECASGGAGLGPGPERSGTAVHVVLLLSLEMWVQNHARLRVVGIPMRRSSLHTVTNRLTVRPKTWNKLHS